MVTTAVLETPTGEWKTVDLTEIVMFLFEQLPKDKREKFLKEVPPFKLRDMEGVL